MMDEKDEKEQPDMKVMIIERRSQKERELSSSEVMRILRKRSAIKMTRRSGSTDREKS